MHRAAQSNMASVSLSVKSNLCSETVRLFLLSVLNELEGSTSYSTQSHLGDGVIRNTPLQHCSAHSAYNVRGYVEI